MVELIEQDPKLAKIVDPKTSHNLLEDPFPLEAALSKEQSVTLTLRVENGPEAPIDLAIQADQEWVELKSKQLSLMGGEKRECKLVVHARGDGEFANLRFSWKGSTETYHEYVLVWRPAMQGVWKIPEWMRQD